MTPGTRLGGYEITASIGEGGMGHVFRARDTRLSRDVALKVLPDAFARDPDRLQTDANEMSPEFSPDGRWLAYVSNESGREEVYAQPYPGPGERQLISNNGGEQPAWAPNGRELFYVQREPGNRVLKLLAVRVNAAPEFQASVPHTVFEHTDLGIAWGRSYDVSPDGQRFLIALTKDPSTALAPAQMIFVQNWFDELKRVVPLR